MFKYKTDLRPNNQVTLTKVELYDKFSPRYETLQSQKLSQDCINQLIEKDASMRGLKVRKRRYDPKTHVIPLVKANPLPAWYVRELDLISKFQEATLGEKTAITKKRGYGETPRIRNFSVSAGQHLRESGAVIDILCDGDPSKCRVITLTSPASTEESYKVLSDYSGKITNKILQIIRDKKDDGFCYFYCLEHQKRGALHWHICLYHQDKNSSRELGQQIVEKWRNILDNIGGEGGVDLLYSRGFSRRVAPHEMQSLNQEMYAGCASYFAKYAGKTIMHNKPEGEKDINRINAERYPVSSFWGRSRNLVALCKKHSFHFDYIGMEEEVEWNYKRDMEVLSQFNLVQIEALNRTAIHAWHDGEKIEIGYIERVVAYCQKQDYMHLKSIFEYQYSFEPSSAIIERAKKRGVTVQRYAGGDF